MHKPAKEKKKKKIKTAANTKHYKILKCYFWSLEETDFCFRFHLSVPEVKKKEKFMFLLKAMLSVQ